MLKKKGKNHVILLLETLNLEGERWNVIQIFGYGKQDFCAWLACIFGKKGKYFVRKSQDQNSLLRNLTFNLLLIQNILQERRKLRKKLDFFLLFFNEKKYSKIIKFWFGRKQG